MQSQLEKLILDFNNATDDLLEKIEDELEDGSYNLAVDRKSAESAARVEQEEAKAPNAGRVSGSRVAAAAAKLEKGKKLAQTTVSNEQISSSTWRDKNNSNVQTYKQQPQAICISSEKRWENYHTDVLSTIDFIINSNCNGNARIVEVIMQIEFLLFSPIKD